MILITASLLFYLQNVFYHTERINDSLANDLFKNVAVVKAFNLQELDDHPYLLTQSKTERFYQDYPYGVRSKYICRPERILHGSVHFPDGGPLLIITISDITHVYNTIPLISLSTIILAPSLNLYINKRKQGNTVLFNTSFTTNTT